MRLIILKTITDKKLLTRDTNYILYCPLAILSMCSRQPSTVWDLCFQIIAVHFSNLAPSLLQGCLHPTITQHLSDINAPFKDSFLVILLVKTKKPHLTKVLLIEPKHLNLNQPGRTHWAIFSQRPRGAFKLKWFKLRIYMKLQSPEAWLQSFVPCCVIRDRSRCRLSIYRHRQDQV